MTVRRAMLNGTSLAALLVIGCAVCGCKKHAPSEGAPVRNRMTEEGLPMARKVTPFLMFEGSAEEAMRFYVGVFHGSEVKRIERYGPGEQGAEGSLKRADFTVAGQDLICFNSPAKHAFTFTPSISFFVECETEAELDSAFERLSSGGAVLMPPDNYGFSRKFAWVSDRYGVSWQLNLK